MSGILTEEIIRAHTAVLRKIEPTFVPWNGYDHYSRAALEAVLPMIGEVIAVQIDAKFPDMVEARDLVTTLTALEKP